MGDQEVIPEDWTATSDVISETGRTALQGEKPRRLGEEARECIPAKRLTERKCDTEDRETQPQVNVEVAKAKQWAYDGLYTQFNSEEGGGVMHLGWEGGGIELGRMCSRLERLKEMEIYRHE